MKSYLCAIAFFGTLIIGSNSAMAQQLTGLIKQMYVHDCCGCGTYLAVIMDTAQTSPPACSINAFVFATSPTSPLEKSLLATALTAKSVGKPVTILG